MLFFLLLFTVFVTLALANPITQPESSTATLAPRIPQQAPQAPPAPAPPQETDKIWLDFTKTFDPLKAETTPPPEGEVKPKYEFVQTTYYSCVTKGTYEHCGWHIPILEVSGDSSTSGIGWGRLWALVLGWVVAVLVR